MIRVNKNVTYKLYLFVTLSMVNYWFLVCLCINIYIYMYIYVYLCIYVLDVEQCTENHPGIINILFNIVDIML